jgi:predicted aspartyl protease
MSARRWGRLASVIMAAALLAAASAITAAPLTLASSGHPVAPVSVNGQKAAAFIVDTGAEGTAVYRGFAQKSALPDAGKERLVGQTGAATLPLRTVRTLAIDAVRRGPLTVVELADQPDRPNVAGIVGLDVMRGYLVEFDFARRRVLFHDREAAGRLKRSLGRPVRAAKVAGGLLAVPVVLNGVGGHAIIDTGARESRANEIFAEQAKLSPIAAPLRSIRGANDKAATLRTASVASMRLPGHDLGATTIKVADLSVFRTFGWSDRPAMLLGFDHIRRFRLIVDVQAGDVWFIEPSHV